MSTPYRRNAKTPAGRIAATPSTANWGGFFGLLQEYAGAAAGYSLRKIGSGPVVRLRRAVDNAEKDFYAGEVVAGTAGAELVTNGGFDTDTDWTKASNWTITGGQAVSDGTVAIGQLRQDGFISSEAGVYYKITFTVVACSDFTSAGTIIDSSVATGFLASWQITSTGTYSAIFKTTGTNSNFGFWTGAGVTMTLDDVSCVPYTPSPAELWALNGKSQIARQANESAYVTTWYDQSGSGNDATQATSTAQPKLITAGVTELENGKPAIVFDGVDDYLTLATPLLGGTAWQTFSVFGSSGGTGFKGLWEVRGVIENDRISFYSSGGGETSQYGPENLGANYTYLLSPWVQGQYLLTHQLDGDTVNPWANGVFQTPRTNAAHIPGDTSGLITTNIGRQSVGSLYHDSNIQELIVYPSDQSANRTGIEGNIAAGYEMPHPSQDIVSDYMPTPAAAYSLRSLDGSTSTNVVRLRRASDNAESDFTAADLVGSVEGSELVTNGDFSSGSTGWDDLTGWTVTGGQAVADAGGGLELLGQWVLDDQQAGDYIKVTFDLVACSDFANCGVQINSTYLSRFDSVLQVNSTGTVSFLYYYDTKVNNRFRFFAQNSASMTVDNVSVVPYTPTAAELWVMNGKTYFQRQDAESAFVTTLYDQSGSGNDATQATSTAQPLIIRAGVTETENGKPAMVFDGVDDYLQSNTFTESSQPITRIVVAKQNTAGYLVDGSSLNRGVVGTTTTDLKRRIFAGTIDDYVVDTSGNQDLLYALFDDASSQLFVNGSGLGTKSIGTGGLDRVTIGTIHDQSTATTNAEIQEIIVYPSDQSANRTIIETNINDHYGIY